MRRIFQLTIEGNGPHQIARILTAEKVERPAYYLGQRNMYHSFMTFKKGANSPLLCTLLSIPLEMAINRTPFSRNITSYD